MSMGKAITAALIGTALFAAPIAAQAQSAEAMRAGSPVAGESLRGEGLEGLWFLPLLVMAAVLIGVYLAADKIDHPEQPHSP
jgi:hypothetical protein